MKAIPQINLLLVVDELLSMHLPVVKSFVKQM